MSKKQNPTIVLVRLVLDEIHEGKHESKATVVANDGKKFKIPFSNIVALDPKAPRAASFITIAP